MFAKTFVASLLATSAFAAAVKRDLPTITTAMTDIGAAVDKMTADIKSWDGAATSAVAILDDSKAIKALLEQDTKKIQATDAIGLFDAISILGPTNTLTAKVDDVVTALKDKKAALNSAALGPVVLQELKDQKFAANDLATAIVGKLPSLAQAIGGPMAQQIVTKLDGAVNAFST